jgi:DNA-directed RNA polymerase subunit RPC12/RpoP
MKDKNINPVYRIDFKGSNNPNYKGDTRKKCVDCGRILGYQNYTRCRECNYKFLFGENYKANIEGFRKYPIGWNKTFKEQIRYRDGYRCQICGVPEAEESQKLSVHHIDYNKMNIKENNLISLCNSCHCKTNGNREEWIKYFSNMEEVTHEKSSN